MEGHRLSSKPSGIILAFPGWSAAAEQGRGQGPGADPSHSDPVANRCEKQRSSTPDLHPVALCPWDAAPPPHWTDSAACCAPFARCSSGQDSLQAFPCFPRWSQPFAWRRGREVRCCAWGSWNFLGKKLKEHRGIEVTLLFLATLFPSFPLGSSYLAIPTFLLMKMSRYFKT